MYLDEGDKRFNLANLRLINAIIPKPKNIMEMKLKNFDVEFVQIDLSGITHNPQLEDKYYHWTWDNLDFHQFTLLHWALAEREFLSMKKHVN